MLDMKLHDGLEIGALLKSTDCLGGPVLRRIIHAFGLVQILQVAAFEAFVFFVVFPGRLCALSAVMVYEGSAGSFGAK